MKKLYLILFLVTLMSVLTGCENKAPVVDPSAVAIINGEKITNTMFEEKKKDLLQKEYIQRKNLERLKNSEQDGEKISDMISKLEESLTAEITPNLVFNELIREIVQEQEAKKQGLTVSDQEVERTLEQSRVTERNIDKDSEEYEILREAKKEYMELEGIKTEKEYEDHLRQGMRKIFLIGHLESMKKEELAIEIAKENPSLFGDTFRAMVETSYQNYVEELLEKAEIKINDKTFIVEKRKLLP
ncbi:MAG: SurA N-terminal domain-containing protein [Desulfitobacteriaceae bacterium]|nr:SurA N-terminal domain-containing protein [Desulfitobacteriaceae bacterium]